MSYRELRSDLPCPVGELCASCAKAGLPHVYIGVHTELRSGRISPLKNGLASQLISLRDFVGQNLCDSLIGNESAFQIFAVMFRTGEGRSRILPTSEELNQCFRAKQFE
jgi:hypothetical protein